MAITSVEGEPHDNSLLEEIETYLAPNETWEKNLRSQISKRVRARYRYQINQEIEGGFSMARMSERRNRSEQERNLQKRIIEGETTGDFPTDACFALLGVINEDTVQQIGALMNRLDEGLKKVENPYMFLVFSNDGEPYKIDIAGLTRPGLEIAYSKLTKGIINLNITTTNGYAHARKDDSSLTISAINSNINIGWRLNDIHLHPTSGKVNRQDSEEVVTLFLGLEEMGDFVKSYPEFAETALLALSKFLRENEDTEPIVFSNIREQEKSNYVVKSVSEAFSSFEWLPASFEFEAENDFDVSSGRLGYYSKVSELMEQAYMIMLVGAYIGESGVVYVDNREEEVNRIDAMLSELMKYGPQSDTD